MAKARNLFVCQSCGHESPRWMGRCPGCDGWNTMVEESAVTPVKAAVPTFARDGTRGDVQKLSEVSLDEQPRLITGLDEFDRVMGGGIMYGSLSLIAGDPGIGKSTLMTELGKFLPAHTRTTVEIKPEKRGTYEFTCGMSMLRGRIVVE